MISPSPLVAAMFFFLSGTYLGKFNFNCSRSFPPLFFTYRYLKLQLPCLGGCDVTGGISNVILVSRRDRSRKCFMNDQALCLDRPDVSRAARGGKGFLKSRPSLSGPGGSPWVHMEQREVTISIQVCALLPALAHLQMRPVSYTLFSSSFLHLPPLILLWEPTKYCSTFSWTFIPFGR